MAVSSRDRKYPTNFSSKRRRTVTDRAKTSFIETVSQTNLFLTQRIDDIRGTDIHSLNALEYKCNQDENIVYLEKTVMKYCENHNKDFVYSRTGNFYADISNLLDIVEHSCPKDHKIRAEFNQKMQNFVFIESASCDFPSYELFFLPVSFLNRLEGEMETLGLYFIRFMEMMCGFSTPYEHFDFCYSLGLGDTDNWRESDFITDYEDSTFELVKDYNEGKIKSLFTKIESIRFEDLEKKLEELLSSVNPKDNFEHQLISLMEEGFELMKNNYLPNYFPEENDEFENDDELLDASRLFCLCYDDEEHDEMTDMAIYNLNQEAQNLYCADMTDCITLSPNDREAFQPSDYPSRWAEWFIKFYRAINN
ncbi:MAG: hypothetical protein IJW68_03375 [Bacteroidaceae bacterium]|nr:hypothetical protein [Bacteroidaceae bacterium]